MSRYLRFYMMCIILLITSADRNLPSFDISMSTVSNTDALPAGQPVAADADRKAKPSRHRALIAASVALLLVAGGAIWILTPTSRESTEDAYVASDATTIAPKVRGFIAEVYVEDNKPVRQGAPLVRIDADEYEAKVAAAKADLSDAEASVASAQAALTSLDAEERLADANVRAAETGIASSEAEASRAKIDSARFQALVAAGAVSRRDADRLATQAVSATQDWAKASAVLNVSRQSKAVTLARRAALRAALGKANAALARAQAALDLAVQDQRHTVIASPIDGVVGNKRARVGDYVQAGAQLMTVVPMRALYVTANFKETQIGRIRAGDKATVRVDALPGTKLEGTVDSLAPGSGSSFALLPFEPGTGNFTKIVQRVPVRISLKPGQPALEALRPGLSVTATVRLE